MAKRKQLKIKAVYEIPDSMINDILKRELEKYLYNKGVNQNYLPIGGELYWRHIA